MRLSKTVAAIPRGALATHQDRGAHPGWPKAICNRPAQALHKTEPEAPTTWRGRLARSIFTLGVLTLSATAQLDTSGTGLSDAWERHFNNGNLFDSQNPAHHPEADPDGDGWTNIQESIAGTDPFSGNPPDGMVATLVTHLKDLEEEPSSEYPDGRIIDLAVISWETLPGKQYTLLFSPDLSASSWLPASAPIIGDGHVAGLSVTLTGGDGLSPDKLFWRVAINDLDSDGDGLTDYEEYQLGLNPFDAETHPGIPDLWIAMHFPTTAGAFNPNAVPHDNGLTFQQIFDFGLDPNVSVIIGPVNLGLREDITDSPDLSFEDYYPSVLFHQDSVDGWQAVIGEHIEIWNEDYGNAYIELQSEGGEPATPQPSGQQGKTYMELQAHWGSHGVKQEFNMLPGSNVSFILRYKGRYELESEQNEFTLKVEGAHEVLFDGTDGEASGNIISKKFMEEDEYPKFASWHYAAVSITADPEATELVPITLSLMPIETITYDENEERPSTYGGFVNIIPIEITAVFGVGPHMPGTLTSRQHLENYLDTVKIARIGDVWLASGKNTDGNDKLYGIEIADNEEKFLSALGTTGMTVVYDGHANFGIGPNFSISTFKSITDFTNFGVKYTAIPQFFRGDGTEPDPMPYYKPEWLEINTGDEQIDFSLTMGRDQLSGEGWAYLVLEENEIEGDVENYNTPFIGGLRFKNTDGIVANQEFTKKGNEFNNEWHFNLDDKYLMIKAPGDEIPKPLRYKTFFYNACSTGPHFIENFNHGEYVHTIRACQVTLATRGFVQAVIEGKTSEEAVDILNESNASGLGNNVVVYGIHK